MIGRTKNRILVLLLVCATPGVVVDAEVNAIYQSGVTLQAHGPFVLSIIEDGDPVTSAWARHSPSLGSRHVLNENGAANGDGIPSALYHPTSKLPIVTWGKYNGSAFDIVESHFENGAWTPPAVIAANVMTATDPEPAITFDEQTGAVHVVYSSGDGAPRVLHTAAPANLSSWTPPVDVSQLGEIATRPHAVIHQGVLTVAYESHGSGAGSTPRQIVVATSDGFGGFGYETISSTHFTQPNRPQLHTAAGTSLWIHWIDDISDMAWATWQPGTGWGPVRLEPFTDAEDRDYHVQGRIEELACP